MDALINTVTCCDALELLARLPDASVDMVLTDPPYNITNCDFETALDLPALWKELERVTTDSAAIVMTAAQPFTSYLVVSNPKLFRYEWIWHKPMATGFLNAKLRPLRAHENILVFSKASATGGSNGQKIKMSYAPRMTPSAVPPKYTRRNGRYEGYNVKQRMSSLSNGESYPRSVLTFSNHGGDSEHPTQKPVALFEYLILTYTAPNMLICDPFCGSGTTGVAARNLNRRYILGDSSPDYCDVTRKRLALPYTVNMFETLPSE